jgi:hypothetical protein
MNVGWWRFVCTYHESEEGCGGVVEREKVTALHSMDKATGWGRSLKMGDLGKYIVYLVRSQSRDLKGASTGS